MKATLIPLRSSDVYPQLPLSSVLLITLPYDMPIVAMIVIVLLSNLVQRLEFGNARNESVGP